MIENDVVLEPHSVPGRISRVNAVLADLLHLTEVISQIVAEGDAVGCILTMLSALPRRGLPNFLVPQVRSGSSKLLTCNLDPVGGNLIPKLGTFVSSLDPLAP